MKEIKKCPFCKAAGALVDYGLEHPDETPMKYQVLCCGNEKGECHACGGLADSAEKAIELWNTRADEERIKELEAENDELKINARASIAAPVIAMVEEVMMLKHENERLRKAQTWQDMDSAPTNRRILIKKNENCYVASRVENFFTGDIAWFVAETGQPNERVIVKDPDGWMELSK